MFFTIAIIGAVVLLLAVGVAAFVYEPEEAHPETRVIQVLQQAGPSNFFVDAPIVAPLDNDIPVALLLAHLEQHIRYEDAAVEAFLAAPERKNLYSQTSSSWVN